eukprot:CAMPEP_0176007828 /NCGR_PEP_ID=MMETSP0120_2-20121206/3433_1 /TAXON_ID=160619 /ORGANISM="Kryptoperidinium foliaceum, Strain CCMP 1326" /LENGTH=79 /DNA_ID=CAMNT_0017340599 /DNA_START=58 /DNA_END=297 /DNA_ORIENTATION=+
MSFYPEDIEYSEKYDDDEFTYRHVVLPKSVAAAMHKLTQCKRLLTEHECESLGVQQSSGWVHYAIHPPELHILLFRRPK